MSATGRERFLIATINHSHAGFFAYVNFAINQIIYAEKHGLRPVVYFGDKSGDGANAFYDPEMGENMWDYYFEPVAGITYSELRRRLADPTDSLNSNDLVILSSSELWRIHCDEPDSVFPYPHSMYYERYLDEADWYARQRDKARRVIRNYIRVKPHVLDKVADFERVYFTDQKVLGIHMRGTDKGTANSPPSLMRVVPPKEYFPYVDAYTRAHGPCKLFAATDQQQFIDQLAARYGDRVLSYKALRTRGIRNPFELADGNGYRKGEDVLIDCLLLSRCNHLLKCTSAVGEFAMYFNPQLDCQDLNQLGKPATGLTLLSIRLKRKLYGSYLRKKARAYRRREAT